MRTVVSKSEYARLKNRSPQAVSAWIKSGAISTNALVGTGHRARIWVERADADLAERLDPGQQLSNEHPANLTALSAPDSPNQSISDMDDYLLRRRKANAERAEYAAEEARRRLEVDVGRWVEKEAMERTFGRILQRELEAIENFLINELPQALESKFQPGISWKEVSIQIRREWHDYRTTTADRLERDAANGGNGRT